MSPKVFFITGTSTGFGNELVKKCIASGDKVVATARSSSKLSFPDTTKDNLLTVDLDVTQEASIHKAFDTALKHFGRIDVVVNNAGYGLSGEFESLSDKQIRTQMEVNFFGLINVTRVALETMRSQKPCGGLIQQITSIGGQRGVPGFSIYCASKWAVEGYTEALSQEVSVVYDPSQRRNQTDIPFSSSPTGISRSNLLSQVDSAPTGPAAAWTLARTRSQSTIISTQRL